MQNKKRILAGLMAGLLILGTACTSLSMTAKAQEAQWEVIESDVPAWKDAITEALGEDTIAGCAMTHSESSDPGVLEIVEKHCNAVTFGNELKPDCMFGYSNDKVPGTEEVEFNGQMLLVPTPTFTRADQMLRKLKRWNDEHPEDAVKVRGHVLLWHSQTPEWFFHENYDKKQPYVDKETMNLRLEWYIYTVLNHFLGEESLYSDMFYGWDVVNEAASDGNTVYRTDVENGSDELTDSTHGSKSSWWHVYESNEFIINAFKYANKYAPADLELYYNDYNETVASKREHIKELLTAVKEAEGPAGEGTRIDAFGMQGHYSMGGFSLEEFETSAREYAAIVGKVQLTELDMKASSSFDGTEASKETEYVAQAQVYQSLFECIKKLKADGVNFSGITFWGTIDRLSWLQSSSNVGGGASGNQTQCPLMFDDDYKVKPAFWAFVDPSKIVPPTQKLQAYYLKDIDFSKKQDFESSQGSVTINLVPLWNEEGLQLQIKVTDLTPDDADEVTVFIDETNSRSENATPITITKKRSECKAMAGYKAVLTIPITDLVIGKTIGIDVRVNNNGEIASFNDFSGNQDNNTSRYAELTFMPEEYRLTKGSATVDGDLEEAWDLANMIPMMTSSGATARGSVKAMWDDKTLYVAAKIKDADVNAKDAFMICVDENNEKQSTYDQNDMTYVIAQDGTITCYGKKAKEEKIDAVVKATEDGYIVEAAISWAQLKPKVHAQLGFNVMVMDADANGDYKGNLGFSATSELCTENTALFGVVKFAPANKEVPEPVAELADGVVNAVVVESQAGSQSENDTTDTTADENGVKNKRILTAVAIIAALAIPAFMYFAVTQSKKDEAKGNVASKSEKNIRRTRRARTQRPNNFQNRNRRPKTKSGNRKKSKKR